MKDHAFQMSWSHIFYIRRVLPAVMLSVLCFGLFASAPAHAHASDQAFVLLLPTDIYISAGVSVVALTLVVMIFAPEKMETWLWRPLRLPFADSARPHTPTFPLLCLSWISFAVFVALLWTAFAGSRDPLANPLPLAVWTVFWVLMVSLQGIAGDVWDLVQPWRGPASAIERLMGREPMVSLPNWLGYWPAVASFFLVSSFVLADPAPSDPERLGAVLIVYGLIILLVIGVFGRDVLVRIDPITAMMNLFVLNAALKGGRDQVAVGFLGWQIAHRPKVEASLGILALVLLGVGSFDGLNETFWWLVVLNVNPLEFPGRSAIVLETVLGLLGFVVGVVSVFALAVALGLMLIGRLSYFAETFQLFALAVLPIAVSYHIGHYLPGFLVEIQYVLVALSDPLGVGSDLLGLGQFYVSTGFFNRQDSVRLIWLTQGSTIVVGHVVSILLVHRAASALFETRREAILCHLPMAAFMVAYTFFGLWLLAAPRGA